MKIRLDQLLIERGLVEDIVQARAIIGAGEVLVDEQRLDKAGSLISTAATVRVKEHCPYVSRGGLKLEGALQHFPLVIQGSTCLDIGASTGGFTDCLLQNGAKKVFAVDVAYGQLAWKLRQDPRVEVIERFNARKLRSAHLQNRPVHLAVIDVSFISLTKIIPVLPPLFAGEISILALIKPQFELAREDIGHGGVVRSTSLHHKAITKIENFAKELQLHSLGVVDSPVLGPKGNREFLIFLKSAVQKQNHTS